MYIDVHSSRFTKLNFAFHSMDDGNLKIHQHPPTKFSNSIHTFTCMHIQMFSQPKFSQSRPPHTFHRIEAAMSPRNSMHVTRSRRLELPTFYVLWDAFIMQHLPQHPMQVQALHTWHVEQLWLRSVAAFMVLHGAW